MTMQTGLLRHRVSIMAPNAGEDDHGQPTAGFTQLRETWADIRFLRGFEAVKAAAQTSTKSCTVRVRYCTDITEGMQVWHTRAGNTTKYNINAVLPDLLKLERVDLVCEVQ
jgi:SPP1 family predicted phage head-tail adaptor